MVRSVAVCVPQHTTFRVWGGRDDQRSPCGCKSGSDGVENFCVGVRRKLVRVPERCFVGDDGDECGAPESAETCGTNLDADAGCKLKRVGGTASDELVEDRGLLEGGVGSIRERWSPVVGLARSRRTTPVSPGTRVCLYEGGDVRGQCGEGA